MRLWLLRAALLSNHLRYHSKSDSSSNVCLTSTPCLYSSRDPLLISKYKGQNGCLRVHQCECLFSYEWRVMKTRRARVVDVAGSTSFVVPRTEFP